jgi:ectoine hydroxylase-related dioxygenase (phytanoyl-CoA dioxygenase family)
MQSIQLRLEEQAYEIKTRGYTIIENVLSKEQVEAAQVAVDEIFARETAIGRKHNWHNGTYKVVFMLPQKSRIFHSICQGAKVMALMQSLLDDDCVLSSMNALSMTPRGGQQVLHQDSPGIPGNVVAINAVHTLDDFTRDNGCTRVVPYSQDWAIKALGMAHTAEVQSFEDQAIYLEAPAGSLIAYNASILHGGSRNMTDGPRRALHSLFIRSWVKPQWDLPMSLSPDVINELTPEQKELFGFNCVPMRYDYHTDRIIFSAGAETNKFRTMRHCAHYTAEWLRSQAERLGWRQ